MPLERIEFMKKMMLLLLGICLLSVTGCQQKTQDGSLSLTAREQEIIANEIEMAMDAFYWSYDKDSLTYNTFLVPQNNEENARIFAAAADAGYHLQQYAGAQGIVATADLLHYNGDDAGEVQFVFLSGTLAGAYYTGGYDDAAYSLNVRNPFLADGGFTIFESWTGIDAQYYQRNGSLPLDGFVAKNKDGMVASIVNGNVELYRLSGTTLSRSRTLTSARGLEAVSAVFVQQGEEEWLAVLLGHAGERTEEEGEEDDGIAHAEKVVLYDAGLQPVSEILLEEESCTALGADGERLFLFVDNAMETYEMQGETWTAVRRDYLKHWVSQCHVVDLDGNGTMEYLMTDGMDLYLYHMQQAGPLRLWSTHLGVESLYGALYSGDLNGDGVKEIYICDATGTTIRWILTETGLRSSNEDIAYGQAIYPCDWNGDGVDDYWNIEETTERRGTLYLSN